MKISWEGLVFASITVIFIGLAGLSAYESLSFFTGKGPTISALVAQSYKNSPHTYIIGVFVFGVILGGLVTHFTNWTTPAP